MKKNLQLLIGCLLCLSLYSCITKYRIPNKDYDYIPFQGGEFLIFESNKGEIDTFEVHSDKRWGERYRYPYRSLQKFEHFNIDLVNYSSKDSINLRLKMFASNWKGSRIRMGTKSNNTNYVNKYNFTIDEFEKFPMTELKINNQTFTDVLIFDGGKTDDHLTIDKIYWSKKNGLVGWDSKNEIWRLKKLHFTPNSLEGLFVSSFSLQHTGSSYELKLHRNNTYSKIINTTWAINGKISKEKSKIEGTYKLDGNKIIFKSKKGNIKNFNSDTLLIINSNHLQSLNGVLVYDRR